MGARFLRGALAATAVAVLATTAVSDVRRAEPASAAEPRYTFTRASGPERTIVKDSSGRWVATYTKGARTATFAGPSRTFAEPATTSARVTSNVWVRILPSPFSGTVDEAAMRAALADRSPDLLAHAMQYVDGATPMFDSSGRQYAGDADYGPLQPDGTREEGSDFNDYLGVSWTYGSYVDRPEADQIRSLDCSGYVRMLFGYRGGVPMSSSPNGSALPRRAFEMLASAPGVVTIPNTGSKATAYSKLAAGDLVFFDAATDDGTQIDHVGIYLGPDSSGRRRFISSRKTANGPTLGDLGGASVVDGSGYYGKAFRAARRV